MQTHFFSFLLLIFVFFIKISFSQKIIKNPNQGVKSHKTLKIEEIDITNTNTIVKLSITNEMNSGAWFCASKDIYLKNSTGTETLKLIKSENIPICPESHQFKSVGEILHFQLFFPKIPQNLKYLDLVENCDNACFSFGGIVLDKEFNDLLNNSYILYNKHKTLDALNSFITLTDKYNDYNYGVIYFNIISIFNDLKNYTEKNKWIARLKNSTFVDKNFYLNILNQ